MKRIGRRVPSKHLTTQGRQQMMAANQVALEAAQRIEMAKLEDGDLRRVYGMMLTGVGNISHPCRVMGKLASIILKRKDELEKTLADFPLAGIDKELAGIEQLGELLAAEMKCLNGVADVLTAVAVELEAKRTPKPEGDANGTGTGEQASPPDCGTMQQPAAASSVSSPIILP